MPLEEKWTQLQSILESYGRVAIAFSGGVDSALVLKCALDVLGNDNVLALFAQSELLTLDEVEQAIQWPANNGYARDVCLDIVRVQPLEWQEFVSNPEDRCYHCKRRLYWLFRERMEQRGYIYLLDGTNCDDLKSHRPGLRAIHELAVRTPLVEGGFDKADVRALSRQLNLTTWNRPSASCLATRIPVGMPISGQRLRTVATLEKGLRQFGFAGCRVQLDRDQNEAVQIIIQNNEFELFSDTDIRLSVLGYFQQHGVHTVLLNLAGKG